MADILKATIIDLSDLVSMGRAFFNEAQWQSIYGHWDDIEASESLTNLLNDENSIIFVAKEGHETIGMIGAYIFPFWLNKTTSMLSEFFWYVKPEHRSLVGVQLKDALDEEAIKRGVQVSSMGSLEVMPSLDKFYERNGYRLCEKTYLKRLS